MRQFTLLVLCCTLAAALDPLLFPYRIEQSFNNASCAILPKSSHGVPHWLNGYFVRQACGAFGDQTKPQTQPPSKIDHLFDCLGMVATFSLDKGVVQFSNKMYNTHAYKSFNFDFSKSKIGWQTFFSSYDAQQANLFSQNWTEAEGYYASSANVNFWPMTSRTDGSGAYITEAVDENTHGLGFDIRSLEMFGPYQFDDDLEKRGRILLGNPAHGGVDEAGLRWSTVSQFQFTSQSTGFVSAIIYKIEKNARVIQGEYKIGNFDLSLCRGDYRTVYPNLDDMMGYMHSFVMTQKYVVLPISSLGWNPCSIFLPRPPSNDGKFFFSITTYQKAKAGRFLVFDRETKKFVANIKTEHFLATHQANWFEDEKGNIVADMITYDSPVYENLFIEDIINDFKGKNMESNLERFVIDTKAWTMTRKVFPTPGDEVKEFSQVNKDYRFKPYKYVYMVSRPFMESSSIIKYNIEAGAVEARWGPFPGIYPGEPVFVSNPSANLEDDGILLVGGVNNTSTKDGTRGFVAVLNAKNLAEEVVALAPETTPFGLHNYFSPQ